MTDADKLYLQGFFLRALRGLLRWIASTATTLTIASLWLLLCVRVFYSIVDFYGPFRTPTIVFVAIGGFTGWGVCLTTDIVPPLFGFGKAKKPLQKLGGFVMALLYAVIVFLVVR